MEGNATVSPAVHGLPARLASSLDPTSPACRGDRGWLDVEATNWAMAGLDRDQLAEFLRCRRGALQPQDVGLPTCPRRRTSGLRREEVAALAGMSTDYYNRLEQRRGPQPSAQVVAALAQGLRLTLDERDHLFRLTGHSAPSRIVRSDQVSPGLMRVLERLDDTPALVMSDLAETWVQNRLAVALLGGQTCFTGPARSAVYRWFTRPAERARFPEEDHDRVSRILVARLRDAVAQGGRDPRAMALVRQLDVESVEFAQLWHRHEVVSWGDIHQRIAHPELGIIELDWHFLAAENPAQMLLVFTAPPGTEGYEKLGLLAGIDSQQLNAS
jgi:transcriptional regulator with XRE-family HTH domain